MKIRSGAGTIHINLIVVSKMKYMWNHTPLVHQLIKIRTPLCRLMALIAYPFHPNLSLIFRVLPLMLELKQIIQTQNHDINSTVNTHFSEMMEIQVK